MVSSEYTPILPTGAASVAPRRPLPLAVAWAAVAASALLATSALLSPSSFRSQLAAPDASLAQAQAENALTLSKRAPPYPPGPNGERELLPFCEQRFIEQPLDHFTGREEEQQTFAMRYFVCAPEHFEPEDGGAIFFYVGNEADVTLYLNHTGLMWEHARDFGALMVFAEHRYFGQSVPFGLDVLDHMQFLSTQQALADYAVLVEQLKAEVHADVPVIGFGGSYGGMLGTWFRLKYPHIIDGVVAGSAPVLAFLGDDEGSFNSEGFFEVITFDMSEEAGSAPNCIDNTRAAIAAIREFGDSIEEREHLAELLRLCNVDALKTEEGVDSLIAATLGAFGNLAMGNYPYPSSYIMEGLSNLPAYPVRAACEFLAPDFAGDNDGLIVGLRDAAGVYYNSTKDLQCFVLPTDNPLEAAQSNEELSEDDKKRTAIAAKGNFFSYLECSELYMPLSTDGVHDVFPPLRVNTTQVDADCVAQWGVHLKPYWAQTEYGGVKALRSSSNIVFSNGDFDPWSATGVRESLSDSIVAVRVPGGAHHLDLMFSHPLDTREVRRAREIELEYVQKWIDEFYAEKKHRDVRHGHGIEPTYLRQWVDTEKHHNIDTRWEEREAQRQVADAKRKEREAEREAERAEDDARRREREAEREAKRREADAKHKQREAKREAKRSEDEAKRREHEAERKGERSESDAKRKEHEAKRKEHEAESRGRDAEREAESKEREGEREGKEAEREAESRERDAEREAERKEREGEHKAEEAEREAESREGVAEREGERKEREGEHKAEEAEREAESRERDAEREAERRERDAEHTQHEAERQADLLERQAERDADEAEREAERYEDRYGHHRGEARP